MSDSEPFDKEAFEQRYVLAQLADHERLFRAGDRGALLPAISLCAHYGVQIPEWAAIPFIRAVHDVTNLRYGSWDDVFGRPFPKGKQLATARRNRLLRVRVYNRIRALRASDPKLAIDEGLFERVGAELGIGKTLTNKLYYQWERYMRRSSQTDSQKVLDELIQPYVVTSDFP